MPKTNAEMCRDYSKRNKLEKLRKTAERVRAYRLRQKISPKVFLNSETGEFTSRLSRKPAPASINEMKSNNVVNQVGANICNSYLSTPTQNIRNVITMQTEMHVQNSDPLSNGLSTENDNICNLSLSTPTQNCRNAMTGPAAEVYMQNSPRLCSLLTTKNVPMTAAERVRKYRAKKRKQQLIEASNIQVLSNQDIVLDQEDVVLHQDTVMDNDCLKNFTMAKTNAEKCRDYYYRRKAAKQKELPVTITRVSTECNPSRRVRFIKIKTTEKVKLNPNASAVISGPSHQPVIIATSLIRSQSPIVSSFMDDEVCENMAPILCTKESAEIINITSAQNLQLSSNKNMLNSELKKKRLEQKRNAEKLKRQKIRDDPEAYENYCRKERARNEKRKKEGKLKLIQQLSDREKQARRKQQNLWKKNSRARQKETIELEKTEPQLLFDTTTNIATESINIKEESIFEDEAHIDIKEEPIIDIKEEPIDPLHEESIISNGEGSPSQVVQRVDTYKDAANMVPFDGIPAIYEKDTHFRNDCLQFANFVGIELQKLSDLNSLLVAKQCIKSVILDAQNGLYKNGVLPSILSIPTNSAIKSERE